MEIRNKSLKKEIVDELNLLESKYFTFDEPVPFKGKLTLYPVCIRNYNEFLSCSVCCTLNKNEDPEGIRMTHLDYLVRQFENPDIGHTWAMQFSRLLELVFHIENGICCQNCGRNIKYGEFLQLVEQQKEKVCCPECQSTNLEEVIRYTTNPDTKKKELIVSGTTINSKDFERLRQIILYQNLPDYQDDSWVDPEVKEDQRLKAEITSKGRDRVGATLEKKIVCVSAKSVYKIDEIYDLSIRKFLMLLTSVDDAITYQADRTGLMTGMVSTKKPLEHWIYKNLNKSMYGEAVSSSEYTGKINSANG